MFICIGYIGSVASTRRLISASQINQPAWHIYVGAIWGNGVAPQLATSMQQRAIQTALYIDV